jgi:hypothetical protein
MQKCLNKDASYFHKKFTKHPWILVIILLFIASGVSIFTISLLCNIKFQCSDQQQNYSLYIGLNICLVSLIFIIMPFLLHTCLNCIYYDTIQDNILPVSTNSPITSKVPPRSRSNSKNPPSPKGPVPKHASKSFRDFHSEA